MRRYESLIILDPEMADEDIVGFTERFSTLIKTSGGEIIKIEDWGSKKLAYLVKKRDKGRYILFDFVGVPALITEMERQYKISEEVIKFLSVKLDEDVDLEAFKAAREKPPEPETKEADTEIASAEAPAAGTDVSTPETPPPPDATESDSAKEDVSSSEPSPEQQPAEVVDTTEGEPVQPPVEATPAEPVQPPVEATPAEPVAADDPATPEPISVEKKEGE